MMRRLQFGFALATVWLLYMPCYIFYGAAAECYDNWFHNIFDNKRELNSTRTQSYIPLINEEKLEQGDTSKSI